MRELVRSVRRAIPFKTQLRAVSDRVRRSRVLPNQLLTEVSLWRILSIELAHLRSVAAGECLDARGQPVPWYTYPAIEFLSQLSFEGRTVFEYGSGNSTLFWCARAGRVVSVEHDELWYTKMRSRIPSNCELILAGTADEYVQTISRTNEKFDVIVVDGQVRLRCAQAAFPHLKDDGLVVLDNSDWFPETSKVLRDAGLIEIDMSGFAPINHYTHTTSLYLRRDVNLTSRERRRPVPGIGSVPKSFDESWWASG